MAGGREIDLEALVEAVSILRRRARALVLLVFVAAVGAVFSNLLREPTFVAQASLLYQPAPWSPPTSSPPGNNVLPPARSSPSFPAPGQILTILASRELSEKVLSRTYTYWKQGREIRQDLYAYLGTGTVEVAAFKLKNRIVSFRQDPRSGVTTVTAHTPIPELSYQIVQAYIDGLGEVLHEVNARATRPQLAMIAARMDEAEQSLRAREKELAWLREKNRDYVLTSDPKLALAELELQREVKGRAEVFVALKRYYESTLTDLLEEEPKIMILAPPSVPSTYTEPRLGRALLLALALASTLLLSALGLAIWWKLLSAERVAEWQALGRMIKSHLPWGGPHFRYPLRRQGAADPGEG